MSLRKVIVTVSVQCYTL